MTKPDFANYPSLSGRTVLVTGGATGIGAELVRQFVAQGARVGFIDNDGPAGRHLAIELADGCGDTAHAPVFVEADLTTKAGVVQAVATVRQQIGVIVTLLNNAANDQRHTIEETTWETWDSAIAINLKQQFFVAQQVVPDMKRNGGGSIVNFGSISWMLKQGGMPVYTTSKAGVQGLTRSLARDLGSCHIRVNTLVPGWVMTEKQKTLWVDDAAKIAIAKGQCIDLPLMPAHIARMALFLAADDSAMCTAQNFIVDGGWV